MDIHIYVCLTFVRHLFDICFTKVLLFANILKLNNSKRYRNKHIKTEKTTFAFTLKIIFPLTLTSAQIEQHPAFTNFPPTLSTMCEYNYPTIIMRDVYFRHTLKCKTPA